jgi:hypothetical protein
LDQRNGRSPQSVIIAITQITFRNTTCSSSPRIFGLEQAIASLPSRIIPTPPGYFVVDAGNGKALNASSIA